MTFFCDNGLQKQEEINQYNALIAQGKYNDANTYINAKTGIFMYSAVFFNLIENRIYALQDYLLDENGNPFVISSTKPENVKLHTIWI